MILLFNSNVNYFSAYEFSNIWIACLALFSAGTLFSLILFILGSFAIFPSSLFVNYFYYLIDLINKPKN
jgi:hypothetical protein